MHIVFIITLFCDAISFPLSENFDILVNLPKQVIVESKTTLRLSGLAHGEVYFARTFLDVQSIEKLQIFPDKYGQFRFNDDQNCSNFNAKVLDPDGKVSSAQISNKQYERNNSGEAIHCSKDHHYDYPYKQQESNMC